MEVKYQVLFFIDNCIVSNDINDDVCSVRDSQGRTLFTGKLTECTTWILQKMSDVRNKVGKEVNDGSKD
uniref:Uncharacterized protein n=1 Tax=Dulem virus 248 TaxID=3145725 RepID=A0AAU8B8Y6_9VIRU